MSRLSPLRYRGGSTKRYRCPTCTRRFATWSAVWAHAEAMHGERPIQEECDLVAIGEREATAPAPEVAPEAPTRLSEGGQVCVALAADPSRSDREIARALGCSPTTVGQIRGQMGLLGAK